MKCLGANTNSKCISAIVFLLFITFCLIAQFSFIEVRLIEIFVGVCETVAAIVLIVIALTSSRDETPRTENNELSASGDAEVIDPANKIYPSESYHSVIEK